jgi:hypothetical protein
MFLAIVPWPVTLAPTNEDIRRENQAEKNLDRGGNCHHDLEGCVRCKDSITINKGNVW